MLGGNSLYSGNLVFADAGIWSRASSVYPALIYAIRFGQSIWQMQACGKAMQRNFQTNGLYSVLSLILQMMRHDVKGR
jgi:hypothetical protein